MRSRITQYYFLNSSFHFPVTDTCSSNYSFFQHSDFRKLRRLVQRKRHTELELRSRLSVLQIIHVGHVVRYEQFLSLDRNECFSYHEAEQRKIFYYDFALSSFQRLRQKLHQKGCRTCSSIVFLHSNSHFLAFHLCDETAMLVYETMAKCRSHFA